MRRVKRVRIRKESIEDMIAAGRYNPSLEITYRDHKGRYTHKIGAGYEDGIHVYRENGLIYVLTTNFFLDYVGLEVFEGDEQAGDVFLQGDQVREFLVRTDLTPYTIIRRLRELIA